MNRFFYRCPKCLFKFTADVDGMRPPTVGDCPVCAWKYIKFLGATRGVLSVGVPCNDKCVFAEGPDCSCSCGGKNHGSKLLIPVVSHVVDFKGKLPSLERAAAVWADFERREKAARELAGGEVRRRYLEAVTRIYGSQSWPHRNASFATLCKNLALNPPALVSSAVPLAVSIAGAAASQLELFAS